MRELLAAHQQAEQTVGWLRAQAMAFGTVQKSERRGYGRVEGVNVVIAIQFNCKSSALRRQGCEPELLPQLLHGLMHG